MTAAATVNHRYLYPFQSAIDTAAGHKRLRLATSGGLEQHPYFFQGRMRYPRRTSDLLLACSEVSRTRFYHPGELQERLLAAADPVVTAGGERLRFESFSVCCGVYCRLDLKPEAIDGDWTGKGTTNVDFNPPMRASLAGLLDSEAVGLNVGADRVELERSSGCQVEKKVKLPVRWLRGFVEVQSYQARMKPAFCVPASSLREILASVSPQQTWRKGAVAYIVPAGKGIRLSQRPSPGAVAVGSPGRLKILEGLLRHASAVRIYSGDDGVSDFELSLGEGSFHLLLSPDAARGFSGEGQALLQLAGEKSGRQLSQVRAQLKWQSRIDPLSLSSELALDLSSVATSLALLGARGLVGYDLSEGTYFHRELPFDLELVEELHPRLKKARSLVAEKSVQIVAKKGETIEAYVQGDGARHRVILTEAEGRCTCPWYAKNQGERGPCSHMLAVEIAAGAEQC